MQSHLCSLCNKPAPRCFCAGCEKYFCSKHFKEHEQQLSNAFDNEVVRLHDELLDQVHKVSMSDKVQSDLLAKIEEWKRQTIEKVQQAAEKACRELVQLVEQQQSFTITRELEPITNEIRRRREEDDFVESDIKRLQIRIKQIQKQLETFAQKNRGMSTIIFDDKIDWNHIITVQNTQRQPFLPFRQPLIHADAKWVQDGIVVAGSDKSGCELDQLVHPYSLRVDADQTIYVVDTHNHRIVEWQNGAKRGQIVAGGNGPGENVNQLHSPMDLVIDIVTDSLIISDSGNARIVKWPRKNGKEGEIILSDISCFGLVMDDDGLLYVVDHRQHAVRRFRIGDEQSVVVAGGNGEGAALNQFCQPRYVFIDQNRSIFVSDTWNHRVMKWKLGEQEGIVVAGGNGPGGSLNQLSGPDGIFVDQSGALYIADFSNNRIVRWLPERSEGSVIIGGNNTGDQFKKLIGPFGLSFDHQGNIYVGQEHRPCILKFNICRN